MMNALAQFLTGRGVWTSNADSLRFDSFWFPQTKGHAWTLWVCHVKECFFNFGWSVTKELTFILLILGAYLSQCCSLFATTKLHLLAESTTYGWRVYVKYSILNGGISESMLNKIKMNRHLRVTGKNAESRKLTFWEHLFLMCSYGNYDWRQQPPLPEWRAPKLGVEERFGTAT